MLHPLLLVPDPWPVPKALHTHSMNGSVGLIFKAWLFPFQLHRGFLIFSWKVCLLRLTLTTRAVRGPNSNDWNENKSGGSTVSK